MEKRTILAILISIAFIVAWEKFVIKRYFPKKPVADVAAEQQLDPTAEQAAVVAPATEEPAPAAQGHHQRRTPLRPRIPAKSS